MRADEIGEELMAALSEAGLGSDDALGLDELLERVFGDADAMQALLIGLGSHYAEPLIGELAEDVIAEDLADELKMRFAAWLACRFGLMLAAGSLLERRRREEMERLANGGGDE